MRPITNVEELQARISAGLRRARNDEPPDYPRVDDVPPNTHEVRLVRDGRNYEGLPALGQRLKALFAGNVDDKYLKVIGDLGHLEELQIHICWASDLSALSRLSRLICRDSRCSRSSTPEWPISPWSPCTASTRCVTCSPPISSAQRACEVSGAASSQSCATLPMVRCRDVEVSG